MAVVTFKITETRTTTVEMDVDDDLLVDPAEHRSANLRALLTQPPEAVLSGRDAQWTQPQLQVTEVRCPAPRYGSGEYYVEYAR